MSDSSSESENSQCDSNVYDIPNYAIEEEFDDLQERRQVLSSDRAEAASTTTEPEDEFDDVNMYAYADEPLANEEWIREYNQQIKDQQREKEELQRRLDGPEPVQSWCKCGNCAVQHLQNPHECNCCQEIDNCMSSLADELVLQDVSQPPSCITQHPGFQPVCLEKWSLRTSARKYKSRDRIRYKQRGSEASFLRSVAYREFTYLIHGYLGDKRRALPACAYNRIRGKFKDEKEQFTGYDDDE